MVEEGTDLTLQDRALTKAEQALTSALVEIRSLREQRDTAVQKAETHELKAKFAERVLDVENSWLTEQQAAKTLGIPGLGPHNLYAWLRSEGILMNDTRGWNLPYQQYIERSYFKIVEVPYQFGSSGDEGIHRKIKVSQKGLKFISDRWEKRNGQDSSEE